LISLIVVSIALNVYFLLDKLSSKPNDSIVPLLVNDTQLKCLENSSRGPLIPLSTEEVFGPESFSNIKVSYFDLSNNPNGFEYEFSNCFYDRIIPDVKLTELDSALGLANQFENGRYYFYKSAESENVTIYAKR